MSAFGVTSHANSITPEITCAENSASQSDNILADEISGEIYSAPAQRTTPWASTSQRQSLLMHKPLQRQLRLLTPALWDMQLLRLFNSPQLQLCVPWATVRKAQQPTVSRRLTTLVQLLLSAPWDSQLQMGPE